MKSFCWNAALVFFVSVALFMGLARTSVADLGGETLVVCGNCDSGCTTFNAPRCGNAFTNCGWSDDACRVCICTSDPGDLNCSCQNSQ